MVVGEVGAVVLALSALGNTRYLRDNVCRTLVRALHLESARSATFARSGSLNGHCGGFKRVLERVGLVRVRVGASHGG
jgi:hypothetical protein